MKKETEHSPILEKLANLEHQQWVKWSQDISSKEILSNERLTRWRNLWCEYRFLSEEMKEFDREWARKVLLIIKEQFIEVEKVKEVIKRVIEAVNETDKIDALFELKEFYLGLTKGDDGK